MLHKPGTAPDRFYNFFLVDILLQSSSNSSPDHLHSPPPLASIMISLMHQHNISPGHPSPSI